MNEERDRIPINIERLREQWKELGLLPDEEYRPPAATNGGRNFDEEPIEVAAVIDNDAYLNPPKQVTTESIESVREEIQEVRETFSKELQDTRESYLLELRSLKGLTLDLASLVYELTEEKREEKAAKKKRFPWKK